MLLFNFYFAQKIVYSQYLQSSSTYTYRDEDGREERGAAAVQYLLEILVNIGVMMAKQDGKKESEMKTEERPSGIKSEVEREMTAIQQGEHEYWNHKLGNGRNKLQKWDRR